MAATRRATERRPARWVGWLHVCAQRRSASSERHFFSPLQANRSVWAAVLVPQALRRLETARNRFGCSISTDGVGASVTMLRPKRAAPPPLDVRSLSLADKRVVGVDPGTNDFFVGVDLGDNGPLHRTDFSCSTAHYYQRAGFRDRKRWLERQLGRQGDLEAWQSGIPTGLTADVGALQARVAYVTQRLGEALAFYMSGRSKRWHAHIRKQRVLHLLARQVTAGREPADVVVGWGNGSAGHGSCISRRGRGPVKEFVRLLRQRHATVVLVDEFRTSRHCSVCVLDEDALPGDTELKQFTAPSVAKPYTLKACNRCHKVRRCVHSCTAQTCVKPGTAAHYRLSLSPACRSGTVT